MSSMAKSSSAASAAVPGAAGGASNNNNNSSNSCSNVGPHGQESRAGGGLGGDGTGDDVVVVGAAVVPPGAARKKSVGAAWAVRKRRVAARLAAFRSLAADPAVVAVDEVTAELKEQRVDLAALSAKKRRLEAELAATEAAIIAAEALRVSACAALPERVAAREERLAEAGVPAGLWAAYDDFRRGLAPRVTTRTATTSCPTATTANGPSSAGGVPGVWTVECPGLQGGSYIKYDCRLMRFRATVQTPVGDCNFRAEPRVTEDGRSVVDFVPTLLPEPKVGDEETWGQLYPELYQAVHCAAARGCDVAKGMAACLPDEHSSFRGGWLLEFGYEEGRDRFEYRQARKLPEDRNWGLGHELMDVDEE